MAQRPSFARLSARVASVATLFAFAFAANACTTHHWAPVAESGVAPPPGEHVVHTDRLLVDVRSTGSETQCVVYEKHHPICFFNIRPALESGLLSTLWPSFPEVVVERAKRARPGDYVLQVDVTLDALPPDDAGPGWSAGVRGRYRVLRDGKVLEEATLASRSRAHFPYGASLGEGATEVVDATILHVAQAVSAIPETRPAPEALVPRVASREFDVVIPNDAPSNERSPLDASATETKTAARGDTTAAESAKTDTKSSEDDAKADVSEAN